MARKEHTKCLTVAAGQTAIIALHWLRDDRFPNWTAGCGTMLIGVYMQCQSLCEPKTSVTTEQYMSEGSGEHSRKAWLRSAACSRGSSSSALRMESTN